MQLDSPDFQGARAYIQQRLRTELADNLFYHGYHHTLDVVIATQKIARLERVGAEELMLLQTAAWFHDSGFLAVYKDHEEAGCVLAREVLPGYRYSEGQIAAIAGMIMATKVPQQPQNHLEQILCDADLEYLGGDNYYTIADSLRRELVERDLLKGERQWVEMQVKFLLMHQYFTPSAQNICNAEKAKRLSELQERLEEFA
jgi:uncharacterized protein